MLKKVLKYVGLVLAICTGLPLVVAPLVYTVKVLGNSDSSAFGLFEDLDGMEILVKDFNPFWIHALQVLVITCFALACVMLVLALLNDLKVLKLQKIEKLLATVLMVVGTVALITVIINQFANSHYEAAEVAGKDVGSGSGLVANVLGWLFPVFALVGSGLVFAMVDTKKKSKKRK